MAQGTLYGMKMMGRWLIALLLAVAIKQAVFIVVIPVWQVPDEPAHVAYVQSIIEHRRLPIFSDQGMDVSPELLTSMTAIEDANPARLGRHYPPGFLSTGSMSQRAMVDGSAAVRNLAARNSPIYYAYAGVPYLAAYQQSLEDRVMAMRAATALLLLVTVWLAVQLAYVVFRSTGAALAVGAVVGWHPAMSAIFAGVNPDAGLILVSTWCLYLLLSPVTGSVSKRLLLIMLTVGLAIAIKPAGVFLAVPAGWWAWRQYRNLVLPRWPSMLVGGLLAIVVGGGWLALQSWRSPTDVVTGPALGLAGLPWPTILNNDIFERPAIIFRTLLGHLGWSGVSVYAPEWVYRVVLAMYCAAVAGSIIWLVRNKKSSNAWVTIGLLGLGVLALELFYQYLYWSAGLRSGATHFPVHGRYYLPLIGGLALWLVGGLRHLLPGKYWWLANVLIVGSTVVATGALFVRAWTTYRFERLAGF